MQSVVMIAYHFPPEGSAGTYRSLRFVRQLAKIGCSTTVISADPYNYERYDPDLLSLVPSETEIIRVRGRDLWQTLQAWRGRRIEETLSGAPVEIAEQIRAAHQAPLRSLMRKAIRTVEACYYQPDFARHWIRPAVSATVRACKSKSPDILWATAGPVSAWVVAQKASHATGLPYVLDLRDPYGLSYYEPESQQPEWAKRKMRRTMYRLLKGARAAVFLFNSVAECYCRAFPGALDAAKIHIIPNGYEGTPDEFVVPGGNTFNVLYTGTVVSYRYDSLLRALVTLKNFAPAKTRRLRLKFVGEGTDVLAKQAAALGLSDIVETAGATSHAEITRLQREAHALLILGRLSTIKGHELYAGAKIFSYLKANRPIFGVLPRDETRNILDRVGVSTIADVDSPSEIFSTLEKLINAWSNRNLAFLLPDRAKCDIYSAEHQTEALIRALDGAPAVETFVSGSVEIPPSLRETMTGGTVRVSRFGWI